MLLLTRSPSNTSNDVAKLKWNSVRCLFEDAQSDILLLLDTCSASDASLEPGTSLKQVIAAYTPEHSQLQPSARSFTATLSECLTRLSTGRPYSVQRLYEDILAQRQLDAALAQKVNGDSKPERAPICLNLTSGSNQNLVLAPLVPSNHVRPSIGETKTQFLKPNHEEQIIKPGSVLDLTFDEARVLVCTTFVGDASPDMAYFKQWLHNTPPLGGKIEVEGMFIGPPTMLLISMPQSIWNVVQHDKVCCFLGYINSHNMIHLYKQLVRATPIPTISPQEVEDGRILLEAREAAANSPSLIRRDTGNFPVLPPDTPVKPDANGRETLPVNGQAETQTPARSMLPHGSPNGHVQDTAVEDSAEMQEAAEQLKALSHVRHLSDEHSGMELQQTPVTTNREGRHPLRDSRDISQNSEGNDFEFAISAKIKEVQARKPLKPKEKSAPSKQETRCSMCSHTPFKDSSSLRKHIAAAHTRPFPCAFSFAGCTSTFGSKNEWKRHIASQHLCLQYYRCSSCTSTAAEGKGNEFNRKDLFTQHLRRMHAPFAVKKSLKQIDQRVQLEWDNHLKEMQQSCLVQRRLPPARSACPKPDCHTEFEGAGSWDEWTEHVGRHMEKGEAQRMGVDRLLAEWAFEEGIIEPKGNGEYRLCSQPGTNGSNANHNGTSNGGGSSNHNNTNQSFISDGGKDDDEPSTAAALSGSSSERMDVD